MAFTYWKQWTGPHPGFWHVASANAQSINVEGKRSHPAAFACHGCAPDHDLQHTVHPQASTVIDKHVLAGIAPLSPL